MIRLVWVDAKSMVFWIMKQQQKKKGPHQTWEILRDEFTGNRMENRKTNTSTTADRGSKSSAQTITLFCLTTSRDNNDAQKFVEIFVAPVDLVHGKTFQYLVQWILFIPRTLQATSTSTTSIVLSFTTVHVFSRRHEFTRASLSRRPNNPANRNPFRPFPNTRKMRAENLGFDTLRKEREGVPEVSIVAQFVVMSQWREGFISL